jgi:hypothetical protein
VQRDRAAGAPDEIGGMRTDDQRGVGVSGHCKPPEGYGRRP